MMATNESENAMKAVDAQHRAAGCFHALLSVLQLPLVLFVATARADGRMKGETPYQDSLRLGLRMHLQLVRDHRATASEATHLRLPEGLEADANTVLQVLANSFDGASAVDVIGFDDGISAVRRLLVAVGASKDSVRQADALLTMLNCRPVSKPSETRAEESGLNKGAGEGNREEGDKASASPAVMLKTAVVLSDNAASSELGNSSDEDSNLSAILDEALLQSAAHADHSGANKVSSNQHGVDATGDISKRSKQASVKKYSNTTATVQDFIDQGDFVSAGFLVDKQLDRTTAKTSDFAKLLLVRARCRFELKQYTHVCDDCQSVRAIDRTCVEAYQWATLALMKLDRLSEARSMCHAGLKVNSSDPKLKALERKISRMALAASKAKKAVVSPSSSDGGSTVASETHSTKGSIQASTAMSNVNQLKKSVAVAVKLMERGNTAEAESSFTQALKCLNASAPAKRVSVLGHRARCRLELKQYAAARDDASEGLKLREDWVEGHRVRCKALVGLEEWQEALVECKAVLRTAPLDMSFHQLKKTIRTKIATLQTTPSSGVLPSTNLWKAPVKALVQAGLAHVEEEKYVDGETTFTKALKMLETLDGSSTNATIVQARVKVLGHRARCRLAVKNFPNAVLDARAGIKLNTGWVDGYRLLCQALMGTRQWSLALMACERVLEHAPGDTVFPKHLVTLREMCSKRSDDEPSASPGAQFAAISQQAIDHLKVKDYETAVTSCSKAISRLNDSSVSAQATPFQKASVYINRARCWTAMQEFGAALEDARTGLTYNQQWPEAHRQEFFALTGLNRWQEASAACERVLELMPTDTTFQFHKATIAERIELLAPRVPPTPASVPLTEGPQRTPARLKADGMLLMVTQDYQAAESKFSDAIASLGSRRTKKSASYFGDRARCRVEMKKFEEALEDARVSLECNPKWTEGFRLQCRAFMGLDQWHKAAEMCKRVLVLAPHDPAFQTIKSQIDERLQRHESEPSEEKKTTQTVAPVQTTFESRPTNTASGSKTPPLKGGVSVARIRELEQFAVHGSIVAQRFLYAQNYLQNARLLLRDGESIETAFDECRHGLRRWPQLEIPRDITATLRKVTFHDAVRMGYQWGGASLYFHLQATEVAFENYASERTFWEQAVQWAPHDLHARTKLAFVLYRGKEIDAALQHVETALNTRGLGGVPVDDNATPAFVVPASLQYLLAMCSPAEAPLSPLSWLKSAFSSQPKPRTRGSELLKYIQGNTVDDEWMPHAYYSIGVLHLAKHEYVEATQYYFLANEAEIRRAKLRLFAEIDEIEFPDKAVLRTAVAGPNKVLSLSQQYEAVNRPAVCAWCEEVVRVTEFFEHKLEECVNRPSLQIEINGS